MEFLRNWIEQVALAVIIASIFEMLLPNGKTKKYIKMILGVFIIFNIISPFVDSSALYNLNVNEIIENYTDNNSDTVSNKSVNDKVEEMYIKELENDIKKTTEEQGYNVESCKIDAVIYSDDNKAGINSINIVLLSKKDDSTVIQEVNQIDIDIKVENTNETENKDNSITEKDVNKLKKFLSDHYEIDKKIININ